MERRRTKRHRRIRARSTTGRVAGAAIEKPGSKPIAQNGLSDCVSPESPCPSQPTVGRDSDVSFRGAVSCREIAEELDTSISRAARWIKAFELGPTGHGRRASIVRDARAIGQKEVILECPKHGVTRYWVGTNAVGCRKCNAEGVVRRRRKVKAILIREAGGCCQLCGFDAVQAALEFHHLDPSAKSFGVSEGGISRSIASSPEEAQKCILLCAICHAGVEVGDLDVPVESRAPLRETA